MSQKSTAYASYAKKRAAASPLLSDCAKAFLFGGTLCTLGQALRNLYTFFGASEGALSTLVPCSLILLSAILTACGVFDNIAKHAGAGTLVPITGFANAVVSPSIDSKAEGFVLGAAAKMFTIAGPVIVFGTLASVVYGVVYWTMGVLG